MRPSAVLSSGESESPCLRRSESRPPRALGAAEAAIAALSEALAVFDAEDRFVLWNKAYAGLFTFGNELRIGMSFRELLERGLAVGEFSEAIGRETAWIEAHLAGRRQRPLPGPIERRLADGRWVRIQRQSSPDGGLVSVVIDISELKQRELALRQSEERLTRLFEGSTDAVCILARSDRGWVYWRVNTVLAGWVERDAQSLTGQALYDVLAPELAALGSAQADTCAATRQQLEFETEFTIQGTPRIIRATLTPFQNDEGEVPEVLAVVKDISDAVAAKRRLGEAQRLEAIGQLAGGVAHDFNNLLLIVDGYAREALEAAQFGQPVDELLGEVITAAARGASLVQQLLVFSRRQLANKVIARPAQVIDDACSLLRPLLGERYTICWQVSADAVDACVETDVSELTQAVFNLATNARDAMPKGGCIGLQLNRLELPKVEPDEPAAAFAEIVMSDTGTGISREVLDHIFEPFFTTKQPGGGTGLGLAMVYGFVQNSGGRIEVDSEPERGTAFRILLPLVEGEPYATATEPREHVAACRETVLLVEDDESVLGLTRRMLETLGYSVLVATNGVEALEAEMEHEGPLDLILTDVAMPVLGGVELAEMLCATRPKLPVVFMSGFPTRGHLEGLGLPEGAMCIQKPFQIEELSQTLRRVMDADRGGEEESAA